MKAIDTFKASVTPYKVKVNVDTLPSGTYHISTPHHKHIALLQHLADRAGLKVYAAFSVTIGFSTYWVFSAQEKEQINERDTNERIHD